MSGAHPRVVLVRQLGLRDYSSTLDDMRAFTLGRDLDTPDELWLLEHPPVYTLGQAGRREHLLDPGRVPVVQSDRGGQVTYHGPGQLVAYTLLDLRRLGLGVKTLVTCMEDAVIRMLARSGVAGGRQQGAPGVYVSGAKIAALGLRIRNGCSYHGLALNVNLDLAPFSRIDPCGFPDLQVIRLLDLGIDVDVQTAGRLLSLQLAEALGLALEEDPVPGRVVENTYGTGREVGS